MMGRGGEFTFDTMLRLALLCLLSTTALASTTARKQLLSGFYGRIVGGNVADPGEYPSQLSLQYRTSHTCGASIISPNWALTAAHCVEDLQLWGIELISGTNDLLSGGTHHQVSRVIMHEDYTWYDSMVNDIAVLEVTNPFIMTDLVKPITLPTQDAPVETGAPATSIGWGSLSEGGILPNYLQEVVIEIRDQDMCRAVYEDIGYNVYPTQMCADSPTSGLGACNGDSGSPLFVDGVAVGIVSWNPQGCGRPGYPATYTRVSAYRDWITQQTGVVL